MKHTLRFIWHFLEPVVVFIALPITIPIWLILKVYMYMHDVWEQTKENS